MNLPLEKYNLKYCSILKRLLYHDSFDLYDTSDNLILKDYRKDLAYFGDDLLIFVNNQFKTLYSIYHKKGRIKRRITYILGLSSIEGGYPYFCTFTINDFYLNKPFDFFVKSLRKRFFPSLGIREFVGNSDYGSKNDRLHFHFVVLSPVVLDSSNSWLYGFCKFELIRTSNKSVKKISSYISKLAFHAVKSKNLKLIYSRCKKEN